MGHPAFLFAKSGNCRFPAKTPDSFYQFLSSLFKMEAFIFEKASIFQKEKMKKAKCA